MLGLRSFWEEIDVPGPSLSKLVIEKLPLFVPTDPVIEVVREEVRCCRGNEWMDYLISVQLDHLAQSQPSPVELAEDAHVPLGVAASLTRDKVGQNGTKVPKKGTLVPTK